jgi:hypothetical protein
MVVVVVMKNAEYGGGWRGGRWMLWEESKEVRQSNLNMPRGSD